MYTAQLYIYKKKKTLSQKHMIQLGTNEQAIGTKSYCIRNLLHYIILRDIHINKRYLKIVQKRVLCECFSVRIFHPKKYVFFYPKIIQKGQRSFQNLTHVTQLLCLFLNLPLTNTDTTTLFLDFACNLVHMNNKTWFD